MSPDTDKNREALRAEATDALMRFSPADRQFASQITTKDVQLLDVCKAWTTHLRTLFEELEVTAEQKKIHEYIAKHFQFNAGDVTEVIDSIVETRYIQALEDYITPLFRANHQDGSEQHVRLIDFFLIEPVGVIDAYFERYRHYRTALDSAKEAQLTLCDPHGSWLDRQRAALQIGRERTEIVQSEENRLDEIGESIDVIRHNENSTVNRIISMDWEYVILLDMRQKYQKNVDKLPKTDQSNPNKLIKIFERVTKDFRESAAERLIVRSSTKSLKGIRDIQESVYDLLLEVFDLSNAERSRILTDIQRYTALRQERDMLLLLQRNREHFLAGHDS